MLNASPDMRLPSAILAHAAVERSLELQPVLFEDLAAEAQIDMLQYVLNDETPVDWSEEDVVFLHWRLLQELADLGNPATPLDEKLDALGWVFTDPERESQPFSFVSCLKVVGCSRLSPTPFFGLVDADHIRDWIRHHMRAWLDATIARYPLWVKEAILQNPNWVESRLVKNPQWINEEIKKQAGQGDFFA